MLHTFRMKTPLSCLLSSHKIYTILKSNLHRQDSYTKCTLFFNKWNWSISWKAKCQLPMSFLYHSTLFPIKYVSFRFQNWFNLSNMYVTKTSPPSLYRRLKFYVWKLISMQQYGKGGSNTSSGKRSEAPSSFHWRRKV